MAVGGLPTPRADHADIVAELALAMRAEVARRRSPDSVPLRMRIGINSGPVVAGVIDTRKFIYDLRGDAVNTASRMESPTASRSPRRPTSVCATATASKSAAPLS